jgi:hypothetical protein
MDASDDTLRLHLTLALPLAATHEIDALVRMISLRKPPHGRRSPPGRPSIVAQHLHPRLPSNPMDARH